MSTTSEDEHSSSENEAKSKLEKNMRTMVFFIDRDLTGDDCDNCDLILLRNPCTDGPSRYLYAKHLNRFFELQCFNEEPRCWFIGKRSIPNGNVYMTNAFDPLYWALYYIRLNCVDRCVPIDQAIIDDNYENTHYIVDTLTVGQLSMIADQKGDASLKAFKYNEEKTLKWLSLKCKKLSQELIGRNFNIGAKSEYFVKSSKLDDQSQNVNGEMLSYAFGIVSEYIQPDLSDKLATYLNLEKTKASNKRKSEAESQSKGVKRMKKEENEPSFTSLPSIPSTPKEKKVSAKEKQLQKAASGTKSISSFFTKK